MKVNIGVTITGIKYKDMVYPLIAHLVYFANKVFSQMMSTEDAQRRLPCLLNPHVRHASLLLINVIFFFLNLKPYMG